MDRATSTRRGGCRTVSASAAAVCPRCIEEAGSAATGVWRDGDSLRGAAAGAGTGGLLRGAAVHRSGGEPDTGAATRALGCLRGLPRAQVGGADSGLRKTQLDPVGCLGVSGECGGDRADLLVAGGEQECRGAAVGLHPGDVEVLV